MVGAADAARVEGTVAAPNRDEGIGEVVNGFTCDDGAVSPGRDRFDEDNGLCCGEPVAPTEVVGEDGAERVADFFVSLWWSGIDGPAGATGCFLGRDWPVLDSVDVEGGDGVGDRWIRLWRPESVSPASASGI